MADTTPADTTARAPYLHLQIDAVVGALHLQVEHAFSTDWTVIFGPSGSGKSSLLNAIAGLRSWPNISVRLHGTELAKTPSHRRRIALVAQQPALFPHLSVAQNVAFALPPSSSKQYRQEQTLSLLQLFRAEALADRRPASLSGGEQQRITLARAIASQPRLLLLDEAFTGLDASLRDELINELRQWQSETRTPILSVTHDVAEAIECAEEVVILHEGRATQSGDPATVLRHQREHLLRQLNSI